MRRPSRTGQRPDETEQARYVAERVLEQREAGIALKPQAVLFRTRTTARTRAGARPPQHSVRQVRRPQVPRGGARQGRAGPAALGREPARPHGRVARRCSCCPGSARPRAARAARCMVAGRRSGRGAGGFQPPARRRAPTGAFGGCYRARCASRSVAWPADLGRHRWYRAAPGAAPRRRRRAPRPTWCSSSASPPGIRRANGS